MATLEEAKWMMVSRKQFAEWCVAALAVYEASWSTPTSEAEYTGAYTKSIGQAVRETVPLEWQPIVACLLTPQGGYSEVWEWCKEQGVELRQSDSGPTT